MPSTSDGDTSVVAAALELSLRHGRDRAGAAARPVAVRAVDATVARKPKTLADLLEDIVPGWERAPDVARRGGRRAGAGRNERASRGGTVSVLARAPCCSLPSRCTTLPTRPPSRNTGAGAADVRHHGRVDMKIGITVGLGSRSEATIDGLVDRVKDAEARGFGSVWMTNAFGFDAMTALSAAGRETNAIEMGTAVVPTYPRHPVVMAQQALTTQSASADGSRSASACRTSR